MNRVAITDIGGVYKQELISQQPAYSYPRPAWLPPSPDNTASLQRKSRTLLNINKTTTFNPLRANFHLGWLIVILWRDFLDFFPNLPYIDCGVGINVRVFTIFYKKNTLFEAQKVISRLTMTINVNKKTFLIHLGIFPDIVVKIRRIWMNHHISLIFFFQYVNFQTVRRRV